MIALFGSRLLFQPEMTPSSLTKMNLAGCEFPFFVTLKNGVSFRTMPVGVPVLFLSFAGIVTISGFAVPSCLYNVETPVPLSLTQITEPLEFGAIPHGFTRFGSV